MDGKTYECKNCGKRVKKIDTEKPECCGRPMKQLPLDVCLHASGAEDSRSMENDEPCDDGRSG